MQILLDTQSKLVPSWNRTASPAELSMRTCKRDVRTHWYVCKTVRSHWHHCQLEIIHTVMKLVMSSRTNFPRSFNMSVSHGLICRILIWDVQLCIIQIHCPTYCDILTHFQNVSFPTNEVKKRNLVSFLTTAYALVKGHLKPTHLKSSPLFTFTTKLLGQDSPSVHLFSETIGSRFTTVKIRLGEDSPSWFVFF